MRFRHPRRAALRHWLQGATDPKLERHLADCERCAGRLETLDADHPDALAGNLSLLRQALERTLAPPTELTGRLTISVDERQRKISLSGIFLDAVGGGVDTLRLLISEDPTDG